MGSPSRQGFWREALALHGTAIPLVMGRVLIFGIIACVICGLAWLEEVFVGRALGLDVTPHELAGIALGLLLVMRMNVGYDRWWEARKLWGSFVDSSRNLIISAMAYGPDNPEWRETITHWVAAYPHVARHCLRGEELSGDVAKLVGPKNTAIISNADHMPSFVALKLAHLLREARYHFEMDGFAFLRIDRERALLVANYGGCERILTTPLPSVVSMKIRHLIVLYLLSLPFALLHRLENAWQIPFVIMFVAYPLLSLDQIGVELENPFATGNLSHLPIDGLSATIERNVQGIFEANQALCSHAISELDGSPAISHEAG